MIYNFEFIIQIQNMKTDMKYRFSIVNFTKPDSLYTCGMKPVLYSKIEADRHFVGWTRVGDNIRYYKNDSQQEDDEDGPSYTLTFTLTFPHTGDTVYLAHCYPYRWVSNVHNNACEWFRLINFNL